MTREAGRGRSTRYVLGGAACMALMLPFLLYGGAADSAYAQAAGDGATTATTDDNMRDYGDVVAVLETGMGEIVIEFFPDDAPLHVANFVGLAESGFYDGTIFHRIIPGFMIQGGDPNTISGPPNTWGMGGPAQNVDAEFNDIEHDRGIVSMARSQDPDSAGSQFFIVHQDSNFLDGQYTAFGRIITESSFETLDMIAAVQTGARDAPADADPVRIRSATIIERAEISDALNPGPPERMAAPLPPGVVMPSDTEQLYDSADLGISFMAPPGWFLQEPGRTTPGAPDVVAVGPQRGGGTPQIYIFVLDNPDGITLDEIIDSRIAMIRDAVSEENFATFYMEEAIVAGHPAYRLGITETVMLDNRSLDVQLEEAIVFGGQKYYTLSYANIPANFEDGKSDFERMLETFEADGLVADVDDEMQQQERDAEEEGDSSSNEDGSNEDGSGMTSTESDTGSQDEEEAAADSPTATAGTDTGGCLIATAAFGSELEPRVQSLRELRDGIVSPTQSGAAFMSTFNTVYYSFSPAVADMEREHPAFRDAVRILITPMITSLSIMDMATPGSELDVIMYGSAVIMLNVGLYVAAPLAAAFFIITRAKPAVAVLARRRYTQVR